MRIRVKAFLDCDIEASELAGAVFQEAYRKLGGDIDDAGCDWATDAGGGIYIHYPTVTVRVARSKEAATLIDASYILRGYDLSKFKISAEEAKKIRDINM